MLCLSGFELYPRWVPLLSVRINCWGLTLVILALCLVSF